MNNSNSHPEWDADAALHALGALSGVEMKDLEQRVARGEIDAGVIRMYNEVFTALCEDVAASMPTPRRSLKESIMAEILPQQDEGGPVQTVVRAEEGRWFTVLPGIQMKILRRDRETNKMTILTRMEPGAAYPGHRHHGLEECYILEGDLNVDGTVLRAGDYAVSSEGAEHHHTYSSGGCLAILVKPLNDEYFE